MGAVKAEMMAFEDAHQEYIQKSNEADFYMDLTKSLMDVRDKLWDNKIEAQRMLDNQNDLMDTLESVIETVKAKHYEKDSIAEDAKELRESLR